MLDTKMKLENEELHVTLTGRLDTLTSPGFEKELEGYFGKIKGLTLDFESLEYISSAGLRTILETQQYMEENGCRNVKVLHINETIRDTFEVTGFMDILDVE